MRSTWKRHGCCRVGLWTRLPATGQEEKREKHQEGEREQGRTHHTKTWCHKECRVCLLTRMSSAFLKVGNFHIDFRDLTAFCLMNEELAEALGFLCFVLYFLHFADVLNNRNTCMKLWLIKAQHCSKRPKGILPMVTQKALCVSDGNAGSWPPQDRHRRWAIPLPCHYKRWTGNEVIWSFWWGGF